MAHRNPSRQLGYALADDGDIIMGGGGGVFGDGRGGRKHKGGGGRQTRLAWK
jgi:hypothetical protein